MIEAGTDRCAPVVRGLTDPMVPSTPAVSHALGLAREEGLPGETVEALREGMSATHPPSWYWWGGEDDAHRVTADLILFLKGLEPRKQLRVFDEDSFGIAKFKRIQNSLAEREKSYFRRQIFQWCQHRGCPSQDPGLSVSLRKGLLPVHLKSAK